MNQTTLPKDPSGHNINLVPAKSALATTVDDTISSATNITLNSETSFLEVTALSYGVFLKYAADASSSSFDEYISAGATRNYIVPQGVTVISVIQDDGAAKVRIIEK